VEAVFEQLDWYLILYIIAQVAIFVTALATLIGVGLTRQWIETGLLDDSLA
jgi:hypothetical protein